MSTVVNLTPDELEELRQATNQPDAESAVRTAMREYLRYARRRRLMALSGTIEMQQREKRMATVGYAHISLDSDGVPVLTGTHTKVVEIVLDHLAHGSDAREIHREFPHLPMGAILSALAYYYDHHAEMDDDIARRMRKVDEIKRQLDRVQGPSPIRVKLKAQGLLP